MESKIPSQQEVIELVKEKRFNLDFDLDIPDKFKANREILAAIIEHGNMPVSKLSEDVFKDRDFLKLLVGKCAFCFGEFPEWVRDDEEMARLAVCTSSSALEGVSARLRSQRDFVMWAFSHDYVSLDIIADESLKNDLDVLKLAVKSNPQNYGRIPEAWRPNEEIIQNLLTTKLMCFSCFDCLPPQYRDDREIAVKALNDDGACFQHLSDRLRDHRELAMVAISDRGINLQHASPRLRDDKEVVLFFAQNEAARPRPKTGAAEAWNFISERLRQDLEVVAAYVSEAPHIVKQLSEELRDSPRIVEACQQTTRINWEGIQSGEGYNYLSMRLKKDRALTLEMSCRFGFKLSEAPKEFRADKEIVCNAVKRDEGNFRFIEPSLLQDLDFLRDLVLSNTKLLGYFVDEKFKEVPYLADETRKRLFTTRIESAEQHRKKVCYEFVLEDQSIPVKNYQRIAQIGTVVAGGAALVEMREFPLITYEDDGPVGSYLTARFINNFVLCGAFQFFVKKNSKKQTLINTLEKRYEGMIAYEEKIAPNDDFLKHEVYLVPDGSLELSYENLSVFPRIYWGRMENLPRGIQLLPSEESYREAFSVLTQKVVYGTPQFIRIDHSTLRAAETSVDEAFGAARVYVDDHGWRFLIPHAEGALRSLEVLKATTDADDWTWIKSRPSAELDARQKELLKSHFGAAVFANEVSTYVGG